MINYFNFYGFSFHVSFVTWPSLGSKEPWFSNETPSAKAVDLLDRSASESITLKAIVNVGFLCVKKNEAVKRELQLNIVYNNVSPMWVIKYLCVTVARLNSRSSTIWNSTGLRNTQIFFWLGFEWFSRIGFDRYILTFPFSFPFKLWFYCLWSHSLNFFLPSLQTKNSTSH